MRGGLLCIIKKRGGLFFLLLFFGPPLPLSRLSGCLLNNYFTLTLLRALSLCHSEEEGRRAAQSLALFAFSSRELSNGFIFSFRLFEQVQLALRQNCRGGCLIVPVSGECLVLHTSQKTEIEKNAAFPCAKKTMPQKQQKKND